MCDLLETANLYYERASLGFGAATGSATSVGIGISQLDPAGSGAADRSNGLCTMWDTEIAVNVHYIAIPIQPFCRTCGFVRDQPPAADAHCARASSIAMYPALTGTLPDRVMATLTQALQV